MTSAGDGSAGRLDPTVVAALVAVHAGAVGAAFFLTWTAVAVAVALAWLTASVGICLGYHRLHAHRSMEVVPWFRYLLVLVGTLAWQGGIIGWVADHRLHHAHTDTERDLHSPKRGFWWAHVGWVGFRRCGDPPMVRDLARDPILVFLDRWHAVPQLLLAVLLFASGEAVGALGWDASGVSWVLWGSCLRTVYVYHATWLVNSAAHCWGSRRFATADNSRNLWWTALLSFGEGWHNNHHAFQSSARMGLTAFELDPTFWLIRVCARLSLLREVVVAEATGVEGHESGYAYRRL